MLNVECPDFSVTSLGDGQMQVSSGDAVILIPAKSVESFQRSVQLAAHNAGECVWELQASEASRSPSEPVA